MRTASGGIILPGSVLQPFVLQGVEPVVTTLFHSTLHSLGGMQVRFMYVWFQLSNHSVTGSYCQNHCFTYKCHYHTESLFDNICLSSGSVPDVLSA